LTLLQALVFDLDGVVVDSHPTHKQAWKQFLSSVGVTATDEELEIVLEGQKREDLLKHFLGELSPQQVSDYGAEKDSLFRHSMHELRTTRGFSSFFSAVQAARLPVALASSASHSRVDKVLTQFDLKGSFRVVVTGDDVPRSKPDPSIFLLAARGLQIRPCNILVCEDAVNGVQAAKSAGMKCLAIAANGREPLLRNAGADKVVPDFTAASLEELQTLFSASD
jgi:beta-phosphoglucomutase-like phosphatase (HAD superfamily)